MFDPEDFALAGDLPIPYDQRSRLSVTPTSAMDTIRSDELNMPSEDGPPPPPPPRTTTFPVEVKRTPVTTTFPVVSTATSPSPPVPPPRSLLPMPPKSSTFKPIKVVFREEDEKRSPIPVEKQIPISIQSSSGQHSPRQIRNIDILNEPSSYDIQRDSTGCSLLINNLDSLFKPNPLDLEEQRIRAHAEVLKPPPSLQFEFRDSGKSEQLSPRSRIPFIPPGQFHIRPEVSTVSSQDRIGVVPDGFNNYTESLSPVASEQSDDGDQLGLLMPNIRMRRTEPYYYQTAAPDRSVLSTIFSEPDEHLHEEDHSHLESHSRHHGEDSSLREEGRDEVGEMSESTYLKLVSHG